MEKFGVEYDEELTKTAGKGNTCPQCGKELKQARYCEDCGTEPWEKRPDPNVRPSR